MDDIVPDAAGGIPATLGQEADAAHGYAAASRAASTRLIYDADWQRFQTWCAARGRRPLPADPAAVDGGKQTAYTFGLNWYPNDLVRLLVNVSHVDYEKTNGAAVTGAPLGAAAGAKFDAISFRAQIAY